VRRDRRVVSFEQAEAPPDETLQAGRRHGKSRLRWREGAAISIGWLGGRARA
jgi:hypothetical protein